jgi:hypothetical protein
VEAAFDGEQGLCGEARPPIDSLRCYEAKMTGYGFAGSPTNPILKISPLWSFRPLSTPSKQTALEGTGLTDYLPKSTAPEA